MLTALEAALPADLVRVDVDWVEDVVLVRGGLGGWLLPLQLAWISLALLLDGKTRRALRAT